MSYMDIQGRKETLSVKCSQMLIKKGHTLHEHS